MELLTDKEFNTLDFKNINVGEFEKAIANRKILKIERVEDDWKGKKIGGVDLYFYDENGGLDIYAIMTNTDSLEESPLYFQHAHYKKEEATK